MVAAATSILASMRGRTARAAGVLTLAAVSLAALAAPAAAAPRPLTVDVLIGDYCIVGQAKSNSFVKVVIRDSFGAQKGRGVATVSPTGEWEFCVDYFADVIGAGDTVNALVFETGQKLHFTVPRVTLNVNRVTDVVSGKAPAGAKLAIEASDLYASYYGREEYDITRHLIANGAGAYSHDFGSDGIDLVGGARLDLTWTGARGAAHVRRSMNVPALGVAIGEARFSGYGKPYSHIGITLKNGATQVATGDAVGDDLYQGEFSGKFIDADGEPYRVVGGEWLSAPALGSDGSWRIPTIDGTTDLASDKVSGDCFANGAYLVIVNAADGYGFDFGTAAADGHFTVDLTDQLNIRRGDSVEIGCFNAGGDVVSQAFLAR